LRFRRLLIVQLAAAALVLAMIGKLWIIQQRGHVAPALGQRKQEIVLDTGRGHFYDRYHRPLTGYVYPSLAVFPASGEFSSSGDFSTDERGIRELAGILGVSVKAWKQYHEELSQPEFWMDPSSRLPVKLTEEQAAAIVGLDLPYLAVVPYTARYLPDAPASQLIGYLGQNPDLIRERYGQELTRGELSDSSVIGVAGLEAAWEPVLRSARYASLARFADGKGHGLGEFRLLEPNGRPDPARIVTTLDLDLQREVERLMDLHGVSDGAVVVLDAKTADVLAMASRPAFDPGRPDPQGDAWANRALKAYAPGSVFKTVAAAAALEAGLVLPQETYDCTGEYGKYGLSCWKRGGHGRLRWAEAFAESCNPAFAALAERLNGAEMERMANRLGLTMPIGWKTDESRRPPLSIRRQFDYEEGGVVFGAGTPAEDGGVKAQTAIGQRDVRLTPLALANMAVTIANGGVVREPRVVDSVRFRSGAPAIRFPGHVRGRAFSRATALELKKWMRLVVTEGTGRSLAGARWPLAGKSGTAQVPLDNGWGENEWFIGFGPADHPLVAAAVLVRKSRADEGHLAVRLFGDVMDAAARMYDGGMVNGSMVNGSTGSTVPSGKWR
jgi:cell division protein FtsI/penicillin-binding protein 2